MPEFSINAYAVLVAVVAKMLIGTLWYSPLLFVKRWMAIVGVNQQQMQSGLAKAIVVDLIGTIVTGFVLICAVHYMGAQGIRQGAALGFLAWLGFIAGPSLAAIVYERRSLALFAINGGFLLVSLVAMGAILAAWQ